MLSEITQLICAGTSIEGQNVWFGLFVSLKILSSFLGLSPPHILRPMASGGDHKSSLHLSSGLQARKQELTQSSVCSRTRPLAAAMRREGAPHRVVVAGVEWKDSQERDVRENLGMTRWVKGRGDKKE